MQKLSFKTTLIAIISFAFALTSCNTSLEVVKRKHRKGYHVSLSKSQNQKGQVFKTASKDLVVKNFAELAVIDSPAVDTSDIDELLPLRYKSYLAVVDSPAVDTTKQINIIPLKGKLTLAQKYKTVKKIKRKVKQIKHQNGLKAASDDDIDSDIMFLLLLILAIILPPASVYLIKGRDSFSFKLNLVLWLIGFLGLGLAAITAINLVWLAYVLAIVHALFVLLGNSE
tara:strand:- start:3426 stop:4106 length:681 start_codon:yes stop_codon:yes gene_type:complete